MRVLWVLKTRENRQLKFGIDIVEYAKTIIDLIMQVGRKDGKRGVIEIHLPENILRRRGD